MSIKIGTGKLKSAYCGSLVVSKIYVGTSLSPAWTNTPAIVVDPDLDNNSWAVIRQVCEMGEASSYWAIGDIKKEDGTDNVSRGFMIVDMQGLYGKHVVFESEYVEGTAYAWDSTPSNAYATSTMNTTTLPNIVLKYSTELQNELTNTTVKVAENGSSSTLANVSNKLFLQAEKELFTTNSNSVSAEFSALTTFRFYTTHSSSDYKIKYDNNAGARKYWLRSPKSTFHNATCFINTSGIVAYDYDNTPYYIAPCFAF